MEQAELKEGGVKLADMILPCTSLEGPVQLTDGILHPVTPWKGPQTELRVS